MAHNDECKGCPQSCCGEPTPCSDYCDDCQNDPNTGWGGYTDHSDSDEKTKHH